jgi:tetratricopeptide (TPR) repeat protein
MKISNSSLSTVSTMIAASAVFFAMAANAQVPAGTATVHGKVTNPAGMAFSQDGVVKITKDKTAEYKDEKFTNTAKIGADGTYTLTGVAPGSYFLYVVSADKIADRVELTVKPTDTDVTADDDMTRAEYMNSMTPEAKKELEEYKKKNAEVVSANTVIANLNGTLKTVRADLDAAKPTKGDVSKDVDSMKAAVAAKPDESILWFNYGETQLAQGEHLAAEDKKAGKPAMSDEDVLKLYSDAGDSYKKAADLDASSKKPNVGTQAAAYNQMGTALSKSGKATEAAAAFENAAKVDPTKAGMYYNNEAAVLTNANQFDLVVAAADKAIAADPKNATPYYLKAQALVTKSSVDPKTQKLTPPPGCVDAYQTYLQLAPDGQFAPQVKEMLTQLGEKIDSKYKAGKK